MANPQTVLGLYRLKIVTPEALRAAIASAMSQEPDRAFPIAEGYAVDVVAAIRASALATDILAAPGIKATSKRAAVRAAILHAEPVKS